MEIALHFMHYRPILCICIPKEELVGPHCHGTQSRQASPHIQRRAGGDVGRRVGVSLKGTPSGTVDVGT